MTMGVLMCNNRNNLMFRQAGVVMCLLICFVGWVQADEFYDGGVTVDIDREVNGWLWVADATVNLYENAWIKNVYNASGGLVVPGEVWAESGAVLNIYGGKIDWILIVTTSYNALAEAQVTVFGSAFEVDGIPVTPGTPELFLSNNVLSGVYESGTAFAYPVSCFKEGVFYTTVKLGWIESAPQIEVSAETVEFGQVEVGALQTAFRTVANVGSGNLSLQDIVIQQIGNLAIQSAVIQYRDNLDFEVMPLAQLPVTMEPNSVIEIEVVFAPWQEGPYEAVLQIFSDDPERPLVEVLVTGVGVQSEEPELTPADKIAAINDFYMDGLKDGSIYGLGPGKSGRARATVIYLTLQMARNLIDGGYERFALIPLRSASQKTSGRGWPRDFVGGPAVPELNALINDLIDDIRGK